MSDAPSRVFEANARLHVGLLLTTVVLHLQHWCTADGHGVPTAAAVHGLVGAVMALGRGKIWYTGQCRAWHTTCATLWCIVVSVCYLAVVLSPLPESHFVLSQSDPLAACLLLLLCTCAGVLHASVGPSARETAVCGACLLVACAHISAVSSTLSGVIHAAAAMCVHVIGALLSAEIFAQQVRIVRFERTIEQQSCRQERTDYDLALSLKDAKRVRRALDEVVRTVRAFEIASAPRPARRVRRPTAVAVGQPLFVMAERAMERDRKIAAATTTAELEAAEAIVGLEQLRASDSGCDTDEEERSQETDKNVDLPNVLARVKAAATPLSADGSLRSSDDSYVARRRRCYEAAEKEYHMDSESATPSNSTNDIRNPNQAH